MRLWPSCQLSMKFAKKVSARYTRTIAGKLLAKQTSDCWLSIYWVSLSSLLIYSGSHLRSKDAFVFNTNEIHKLMCFAFVYTLNERQLVRNRHYSSLLPRLLLLPAHFCLLRVSFIHEVNIKQQKIIMTQHVNWSKQNWVRSLETARARVREGDWSEALARYGKHVHMR